MQFDDIELMCNLINENGFKSNYNNEKLSQLFKSMDYENLIKDFEESLATFPSKNKYPHYATIFYLFLTSMSLDNINDLANALKAKKSYNYLINGLKMLISGRSKTLHYNIELADKSFKNKYKYISRFVYELPYWENSALIFLLKVIYYIDKKDFFKLLEKDKSNFLFLIFFSRRENIECNDELLIKFLNNDDEMKSNGVLYCLMLNFHRDYREYLNNKNSEEIKECLNITCQNICRILKKVEKNKRIKLILNYITVEEIYPTEFVDILTEVEVRKILLEQIELIELKKVEDLISLQILLGSNDTMLNNYLEKFFIKRLYKFIKNNSGIYDNSKFKYLISKINKKKLSEMNNYIEQITRGLKLSEYDRQVRFVQFHQEVRHYENLKEYKKIIMECIDN